MPSLIDKMDTIKHHAKQIGILTCELANNPSPVRQQEILNEIKIRQAVIKQLS